MTTLNKNIGSVHMAMVEGEEIEVYRLKYLSEDGNPQYVVHFLSLGLTLDEYRNMTDITKYRGKWFGGAIKLVDCYSVQDDINKVLEKVAHYRNPYAKKPNEKQMRAMERLAKRIERQTNNGLASAFYDESYFGHDSYCMVVNASEYQNKGGHVVFNTYTNKAEFIGDSEE